MCIGEWLLLYDWGAKNVTNEKNVTCLNGTWKATKKNQHIKIGI